MKLEYNGQGMRTVAGQFDPYPIMKISANMLRISSGLASDKHMIRARRRKGVPNPCPAMTT